jgi:hypothetical protein
MTSFRSCLEFFVIIIKINSNLVNLAKKFRIILFSELLYEGSENWVYDFKKCDLK